MATSTAAGSAEEKSVNLSSVLETLTTSLASASTSLPASEGNDGPSILPPAEGISLLDVKSELLLSYLQNLVFLILNQLQRLRDHDQNTVSNEDVVKKLTELRVYLDRGVRPLESKLKYQIDKVVKAADDAERSSRSQPKSALKKGKKAADESDEEDDSEDSGSDDSQSDEEEEEIDEMAYRPNISAFAKNMQKPSSESKTQAKEKTQQSSDGIYRPPRIKPTALPTTESRERNRERENRRSKKSSVIDEFVSTEMSSAPVAEPSIGSTIQRGGRQVISQRDREREAERRAYEETNFVRLPKESKKERAKRRAHEGPRAGGFGGEEFRLLSEGADRIGRLTKRASGKDGALEKSRKRRLTEDGPRGDGAAIGQSFEKRRKKVEGWKK